MTFTVVCIFGLYLGLRWLTNSILTHNHIYLRSSLARKKTYTYTPWKDVHSICTCVCVCVYRTSASENYCNMYWWSSFLCLPLGEELLDRGYSNTANVIRISCPSVDFRSEGNKQTCRNCDTPRTTSDPFENTPR